MWVDIKAWRGDWVVGESGSGLRLTGGAKPSFVRCFYCASKLVSHSGSFTCNIICVEGRIWKGFV